MSTNKEFLTFVLDQLSGLEDIKCKSMMGEYLIYYKGLLLSYIYDNCLLIKVTKASASLPKDATLQNPYPGASKKMFLYEELEDKAFLCSIFKAMYSELVPKA